MGDKNMRKDSERIEDKLLEVGASLLNTSRIQGAENVQDMRFDFWEVNGKGLIVCNYEDGSCGLYGFVGEQGAPVENDLEFIEAYDSEPLEYFDSENN